MKSKSNNNEKKKEDQEMTPSHGTIAPSSERGGEGTIRGANGAGGPGEKNQVVSASEDWRISVEGEIKLLRSENEEIRDDNKSLQDKFEKLEDNVKTLLLLNDEDDSSTTSDGAGGGGSDVWTSESDDTSNGADDANSAVMMFELGGKATPLKQTTTTTKKKKKPKKKKKGRSKVAKYFGVGGSLAKVVGKAFKKKLTVGLISIAMLLFLSIIGQGVTYGGTSSPFHADKSVRAIAREKLREMIGTAEIRGGREAQPDVVPGDDEGSETGRKDKEDFWSRILQENSLPQGTADGSTAFSVVSAAVTSPAPTPMETFDSPNIALSEESTGGSTALPTYATTGFVYPPGFVCDADINSCGCPDVLQSDYRGTISTATSGFECENWSEDLRNMYPEAGLEGNFCRNPYDDLGGPLCKTANPDLEFGIEYCDVPVCGSIPTASPFVGSAAAISSAPMETLVRPNISPSEGVTDESTVFPTYVTAAGISPVPTPMETLDRPNFAPSEENTDESSTLPTYGTIEPLEFPWFVCNADINTCGCPEVLQSDYRGTKTGFECENWDAYWVADYPKAGLEENFCRNPDGDPGGAWCLPTNREVGREYCNVPVCGNSPTTSPTTAIPTSSSKPTVSASPSAIPTSSQSPTQMCQAADNTRCGCQVQLKSDYRGSISTTAEGIECENWDAAWLNQYIKATYDGAITGGMIELLPNAGLEENFCRNPGPPVPSDDSPVCILPEIPVDEELVYGECFVPDCNPCSCMPPCGEPNPETCGCPNALQADSCCDEEDASCKCAYLKDACSKSLENGTTDFCDIAEAECCKDKDDPNCKCNMFEQICSEGPSQPTCDFAANICCEHSEYADDACLCDFYTYAETSMNYKSEYKMSNCTSVESLESTTPSLEKEILEYIYEDGGGEYWVNNTGWLEEDVHHCDWFGVGCDGGLVTEINWRNNNLTSLPDLMFPQLTKLDVAENKLSGTWMFDIILTHRKLAHIDISGNQLSGHADMTFPPATLHANFSNNNFTSVGFKRFNAAYETLQVLDMSNNRIKQDTSEVFLNIPHNLERLILSNNAIEGTLPNPFPLQNAKHFAISDNNINGILPDFSGSPQLVVLDLSNQKQSAMGGLTGTIPTDIYVADLEVLDLSANKLTGPIPVGKFERLRVLDLSSNALSDSIPKELGNLQALLEVLDLSMNELTGRIPSELNNIQLASVRLSGNANISTPAPLTQCTASNFDLMNDTRLCPPERSVLKAFYEASKGLEWTVDDIWLDEYESHCKWYGVKCNPANNSVELVLHNNGLSGTLSTEIGELNALEKLDLSDNDIKGSIPTELGLLSQLFHLRLNFNSFKGNETNFGTLKHLEVIQIQSNRLSGTIPLLNLAFAEDYSFIADCGNPSDFDESLTCEECTMCCNNQDDCYPTEETNVQGLGFNNYFWFTGAFFLCLLAFSCTVAVTSFVYDKHINRIDQPSSTDKDSKYALEIIGDDSVYQFFLGNSIAGWIIVLATTGIQIWMLSMFVQGAEIDLSDDASDLVYTYKCPRDEIECRDTSDLTWRGWTVFIVLMAAHLLKDIINGLKLTVLSAKERHGGHASTRFFFGGWLLTTVTVFTLYVSTIYNAAIGTSNTEVIMNSVVILFITDIDELFYDILMTISPSWVESMSYQEEEESVNEMCSHEKGDEEDVMEMEVQQESNQHNVLKLAGDVEGLKRDVKGLQEENADLRRRLMMPQDFRV